MALGSYTDLRLVHILCAKGEFPGSDVSSGTGTVFIFDLPVREVSRRELTVGSAEMPDDLLAWISGAGIAALTCQCSRYAFRIFNTALPRTSAIRRWRTGIWTRSRLPGGASTNRSDSPQIVPCPVLPSGKAGLQKFVDSTE
jgi:hypothetical protein